MKRRAAISVIAHFEEACRDDEMRGCAHPYDRDHIHNRYLSARERLIRHLTKEQDQ